MSKVRSNNRITLIPITGFPELSINEEIVMQDTIDKIKIIYKKFGFVPLETRLVELDTILKKKGIDNKELYCLNKTYNDEVFEANEEQRKLALRFDLTVPMARYIGQNQMSMSFPFKRYQIQKVYRAEDSKTKKGRFNEFYQCDIDVIGRNKLDLAYDSEIPSIIYNIFNNVFNISNFILRVNNRKLLEGLFMDNGLTDVTIIKRAVKIIDDIEKVDRSLTITRLQEIGMEEEIANKLLVLFKTIFDMEGDIAIKYLMEQNFKGSLILEGIEELDKVINGIIANGVPKTHFRVDLCIARGLDYYTGTVYETILIDHPELGSVCSGGRYNGLVGTLTGNKRDVYPGVGISIGLSRLMPTLISKNYLDASISTTAPIMVSCQSKKRIIDYQKIGNTLRQGGYNVDVYLNRTTKLPKQLDYANSKGIKYVIIANETELNEGKVIIRDMLSSTQEECQLTSILDYFNDKL